MQTKKCQKVLRSSQKRAKKYTKKYMKVPKKLRGGGEFQKDPANAKKCQKGQKKKRKKEKKGTLNQIDIEKRRVYGQIYSPFGFI